jgi:translation initiation factor IF-1
MAKSQTLKTEVVQSEKDRIIFKLQQEYTPRVIHFSKPVNSLITLTLDDQGKIKYHKDMWNEKDYSHEGLGKVMKTLNGDHLTKVSACSNSEQNVYVNVLCRLPSRRRPCSVDMLHEDNIIIMLWKYLI